MNLTNIAKQVLKEDSWGNNPSAAGGMSPGRAPTATTPPPAQSGNVVDISQSFRNFKLNLEKNEEAIVKEIKKSFASHSQSKRDNRVILSKFIDDIAAKIV